MTRRFGVLWLCLLTAACSSVGPMPAEGVPEDDEVGGFREVFADDLRGDIQIETPIVKRTDQNLLRVSVPIRNIAGEDLQLFVQMQFLDETGAPYNDETNRRLFLLPRGTTRSFQATSGQSVASDYRVHIWRAE